MLSDSLRILDAVERRCGCAEVAVIPTTVEGLIYSVVILVSFFFLLGLIPISRFGLRLLYRFTLYKTV